VKNLSSPRLEVLDENGLKRNVKFGYVPGNIAIDSNDYRLLKLKDNFSLIFSMQVNDGDFQHYKVEAGKGWLNRDYTIAYTYNTDNKKSYPIPCQKHTYELEYTGGQMLRPRKK